MARVPEERREKILSELKRHGYLSVAELADVLFVSIPTVRRDLSVLEKDGALVRTHGGASNLADDTVAAPYALRYRKLVAEKLAVGSLAARLIKNGNRIFTDASTTIQAMIHQIPEEMNLIVLTNGVQIARELGSRTNVRVELPGGVYNSIHEGIFGEDAMDFARKRSADLCFISCDGVDYEAGVMSNTPLDGPLKRVMVKNAKRTVLLMDHTKEDQMHFYHILEWSDIDVLITDRMPGERIIRACKENGIELIVPKRD